MSDSNQPTRHAKFMRGVVAPIFGLLAVACVVLGILNSTIWRPSSSINARTRVVNSRYIVTDLAVLNLVDEDVKIEVNASSNVQLCVALGARKDVNGWLAGQTYTRITGLSSWDTLSTQRAKSTAKSVDSNAVSFSDSDLWTSLSCAKHSVVLNHKGVTSQVAIIDVSSSSNKVDIVFHWNRKVLPHFDYAFYFVAFLSAIMTVLCASVFAMSAEKRRIQRVIQSSRVQAKESWHTPVRVRARRRHARGRHSGVSRVASVNEPLVVDPLERNMVAEQGAVPADSEMTTVFDVQDLQAYFARFSQEIDSSLLEEPQDVLDELPSGDVEGNATVSDEDKTGEA